MRESNVRKLNEIDTELECNECIYAKILGKRNLMRLGSMCCHADIINYGSLPYTNNKRTERYAMGDTM